MRTIAVGVSRFGTGEPRSLPYAAADARRFAEGLQPRGTATALLDADATAAGVRKAFRSFAGLDAADSGIVFIACPAAARDGDVRLQVFDGEVSLTEILRRAWDGIAGRIVLLLDIGRDAGDALQPTAEEIRERFPVRPGRVLLLSDDGRHGSFVSGELQAGIWAWHVAAAFAAEAPLAQNSDGAVTVASLRGFLAQEVPRSLARAYRGGREQSPVILAADDGEVLLDPIPSTAPPMTSAPPLAGVRFFSEQVVPVKALGGFRKGVHSVPSDASASSREWVARLAEPDLTKELEEIVGRLRQHLQYKRRDLRADGPTNGAASVLTPDFSYHITANQHETKPDRAVFRRTLAEITNAGVLNRPELADAFPQGFTSLYQPFDVPADVQRLIDALEDHEPPAVVKLDYPTDLSHCTLELAGFDGRVRIDRDGLTVRATGPASPQNLAAQFALVKQTLKHAAG
jgi:hypothetical protein